MDGRRDQVEMRDLCRDQGSQWQEIGDLFGTRQD